MKEYVFNQTDNEDHVKYMSKNFVEDACVILDGIFSILTHNVKELKNFPDPNFEKEMRDNIFCLPSFILDFLIEVCQIPAEQNQLYLCRSDFFDFLKDLMTVKEHAKTYKQELFILDGESAKENMFFQI